MVVAMTARKTARLSATKVMSPMNGPKGRLRAASPVAAQRPAGNNSSAAPAATSTAADASPCCRRGCASPLSQTASAPIHGAPIVINMSVGTISSSRRGCVGAA